MLRSLFCDWVGNFCLAVAYNMMIRGNAVMHAPWGVGAGEGLILGEDRKGHDLASTISAIRVLRGLQALAAFGRCPCGFLVL